MPPHTPSIAPARSKLERLGHLADARLLIVHADDIGMAHAQNAATIAALEHGVATSGSLIVCAPWVPEFMAWYRRHPDADIGVHLTLTAEWHTLRWAGVLSREEAPSLRDDDGYFPTTVAEVARRADPVEAERELRAQVARARELGLRPTHLDTHMGAVFARREIFEAYLRIARENALPAAVPRGAFAEDRPDMAPGLTALVGPRDLLVDDFIMAPEDLAPDDWPAFYTAVIEQLRPGTITQLIVHLAHDGAEMRALTAGYQVFDASWRQRDFDFLVSPAARRLLRDTGVVLTTWRKLGRRILE